MPSQLAAGSPSPDHTGKLVMASAEKNRYRSAAFIPRSPARSSIFDPADQHLDLPQDDGPVPFPDPVAGADDPDDFAGLEGKLGILPGAPALPAQDLDLAAVLQGQDGAGLDGKGANPARF